MGAGHAPAEWAWWPILVALSHFPNLEPPPETILEARRGQGNRENPYANSRG